MLPYRLRQPTYGGKLKQLKSKESFAERAFPYRDGGPLERAIESDLRALLPLYEDKLEASIATDNVRSGRVPVGTAFQAFREVFSAAKVAMLFRSSTNNNDSGLMPQRCDRNAYSQLVYAACLVILRDFVTGFHKTTACSDGNNTAQPHIDLDGDESQTFLRRVSYAIFTLYALYHTNPLPSSYNSSTKLSTANDENKARSLAMLPMGLQDRENPKIIYRHAFRSPVRIDLDHYGYLLEIGHLANATLSQCESNRHRSTNGDMSRANDAKWSVASDLSLVLHRMLYTTPNMLEFCSYTGPCGLEGLAGHRDYPFPASDSSWVPGTTVATLVEGSTAATTIVLTRTLASDTETSIKRQDSHVALAVDGTLEPSWGDLEQYLQKYTADRQSIRIPGIRNDGGSQKLKRVREALQPMFSRQQNDHEDETDLDPVSRLLDEVQGREPAKERAPSVRKRGKFRHVSFTEGNSSEQESQDPSLSDQEQDPSNASSTPGVSFELILPNSLNAEVQESLRGAVNVLLLDRKVQPLPAVAPCDKTPLILVNANDQDNATSTLGENEGASVAHSLLALSTTTTTSAIGRSALRALLARAKSDTQCPSRQSAPRPSVASFLEAASTKARVLTSSVAENSEDDSHVSDLSSDDEISVAASRVGQRALQALLDTSRKVQRQRRRRQDKQLDRSKPSNKRLATSILTQDSDASDSIESSAPIGHGASALDTLLQMSKAKEQQDAMIE